MVKRLFYGGGEVGGEEKCRLPWLTGDKKFSNYADQNTLKQPQNRNIWTRI